MATKTQSIYDSAQRRSAAFEEIKELFRYRSLVLQLVRRDVLTRYKRSVLGVAWTMLNPLGTMIVLTVVFSQAFGGGPQYAPYVLSGLIAWNFFAQSTNAAMVHLVWGEGLLKRIYLPRTVFAISAIGTALVNILLSLIPLVLVMLATRVPIRLSVLFVPVPILFLTFFALGIGLLLSTVAVYFADVAEMYQIGITAWMYLSPVIYPENILPPIFQTWLSRLNPMYNLIKLFRLPIYEGVLPDFDLIITSGVLSLVTLIIGWLVFTRKADEFAYRV